MNQEKIHNSIKFISILHLFVCLLSRAKANYKVGMSKETNKTNTYTQRRKKSRQCVSFRQKPFN
jgi:hypothetical protein